MEFREAMERYRAGCASEEEKRIVETEVEKSRLIAEYLDESWGKDWAEDERKNLAEAIRLNLINQKEYPFEMLQRKYNLPCSRKVFRREARIYVNVLSGLCGFE